MRRKAYLFVCVTLFFSFAFFSCKKDSAILDSSAKLQFSVDSVFFDTVFSGVGSTTRLFKIYNSYKQKLIVSRAYLATGTGSQFRISIDGESGPSVENIELLPNDSLFVFVQVTVNPTGLNAPLLVEDKILFVTNGNIQSVSLTAIGQDVYLHKPNIFPMDGTPAYSLIDCSGSWINDKPHLVFGYAVVNTDSTLFIGPGTRVYMNKGAVLQVSNGGCMKMIGSKDSVVSVQGARLEVDYQDLPGQWGKIWLKEGSKNNEISWAVIRNGSIGVQADSLGFSGAALLTIGNTIIKNMSTAALYSNRGHIRSYNSVYANGGLYSVYLRGGGNYTFIHCTLVNYWSRSNRSTALLDISNYYDSGLSNNLDSAYFGNCIIDGILNNEVNLDAGTGGGAFNYTFRNCLVKTSLDMTDDGLHYNLVYKNALVGFVDTDTYNYQLLSTSGAIDNGYSTPFNLDLNNKVRPNPTTSISDLGAYEYY